MYSGDLRGEGCDLDISGAARERLLKRRGKDSGCSDWTMTHDGSMVLLYMVTWIPSIYPLYVSIYTIHIYTFTWILWAWWSHSCGRQWSPGRVAAKRWYTFWRKGPDLEALILKKSKRVDPTIWEIYVANYLVICLITRTRSIAQKKWGSGWLIRRDLRNPILI